MSENTTPTPDARGWSDAEVEFLIRRHSTIDGRHLTPTGQALRALLDERAQHADEVDAAVRAEREACAEVADDLYIGLAFIFGDDDDTTTEYRDDVAERIRARGTTDALAQQIAEAEKRGAERMREVLEQALIDLSNTRSNIMVDLAKGNTRWEGVAEALKARIDEYRRALPSQEPQK